MNKILLTGASGFLGVQITNKLRECYQLTTCGRSKSNDIICDLSNSLPVLDTYDLIIHAAGKAHVMPKNKKEQQEFYSANYQSTVNLTKAFGETTLPKGVVFISTVAVYGRDTGESISEEHPLMGSSAYAKSKIAAEEFLSEWGKKNNVNVTIFRLPLIAGPDPPGNLGAMKKAIAGGYYFRLGSGDANKSMVWAADLTSILSKCFQTSGIYNLTDGNDPTIKELDSVIGVKLNKNIKQLPISVLKLLALPSKIMSFWPINTNRINKLTNSLTFSSEKAIKELGWNPHSVIECIKEYGI